MSQYRVSGTKGGGSSCLSTVINAVNYKDAEKWANDIGYEDVAVMPCRYPHDAQYDTPAYTAENER